MTSTTAPHALSLDRLPHTLPTEQILRELATDLTYGLTTEEVERRRAVAGFNELQETRRVSPWTLLLAQFKNSLIVILLVGAALSTLLGHAVESITIIIIVFFAAILGFVQEYRAERAMESLKKMIVLIAGVRRNGEEAELPARELVPGDIIALAAGDKVPADARLVENISLKAVEAALTGESLPVGKHTQKIEREDMPLGDRRNMVYAGTSITNGKGWAVVTATGMRTEFGKIAGMLQTVETGKTPLQNNLDHVGNALLKIALVIVALIGFVGVQRGQPILDMLVFGIALAVAVVPEALPAVVTVSLALGVQRMAKQHALVRRLPAVETLGAASVICSDKTGTLTRDQMTVRRILVAGIRVDVTGAGYEPRGTFSTPEGKAAPVVLTELLRAAALSSDAVLLHHTPLLSEDPRAGNHKPERHASAPRPETRIAPPNREKGEAPTWVIRGDPTEGALVVAAAKAGLRKDMLDEEEPRIGEIPFTSETKRMTTLHRVAADPGQSRGAGSRAYAKGAPEVILDACTAIRMETGVQPLTAEYREEIHRAAHAMAGEALRVLAVAAKDTASLQDAEGDLVFLGLLGMIDPPRTEAKAAVEECRKAGIRVVLITGDHPLTAKAIARELGILGKGRVVTGTELHEMDDITLASNTEDIEIYARVSPADKLRIVTALQSRGHVVAMTGDGVNDAPALKKADIGIAMGITGTDVSREAAAMTLTDDNFASIVAAVREGRAIFGNIRKYLMYLLSSNVGEICLMAFSALFGLPLPLSAVQILYVNLATDGLPALALALNPPHPNLMRVPPRDTTKSIFTGKVVTLLGIGGLWIAIANLTLFGWALSSGRDLPAATTLTFLSLCLMQFFNAYNFRSHRHSILSKPFANRWLNTAVVWELLLLGAIFSVPFLRGAFGLVTLSLREVGIAILVAATIVPVMELGKFLVRHWRGSARTIENARLS